MDIDIDFHDRTAALKLLKHIPASRLEEGKLIKHNTGVYFHCVPYDPILNSCSIPYDTFDEFLFKVDFLNVSMYLGVRNEEHLLQLMNTEPLWELLEQEEFVKLLFHINNYYPLVNLMKPKSIEQLAAVLAIIRPAKRHLAGRSWKEVFEEVWKKPESDSHYFFKKSHSISYAIAIVVQMNLICEQAS